VLFELHEVSLEINGQSILNGVSTSIPEKGITVLQGPSGSGKSSLLRLLNRLDVPTSGEIWFRGQPLDQIDPLALRRRVGMVFQQPTPFPGTVRDNLKVADQQASEAALIEALKSVGLAQSVLDRVADELSGGESQRACLARTLLTHPEVLLMDEPTSALDEEATHYLENTAHRLANDGMPMVWVTHDPGQAGRLADHYLRLSRGRVLEQR
jgi:putative ABC transport system ATP-binding protein